MRPIMSRLGQIHQRFTGSGLPGESGQEQSPRHGRAELLTGPRLPTGPPTAGMAPDTLNRARRRDV